VVGRETMPWCCGLQLPASVSRRTLSGVCIVLLHAGMWLGLKSARFWQDSLRVSTGTGMMQRSSLGCLATFVIATKSLIDSGMHEGVCRVCLHMTCMRLCLM